MSRIIGAILMIIGGGALLMGGQSDQWLLYAEAKSETVAGVEVKNAQNIKIGLKSWHMEKEYCVAGVCESKGKPSADTHEAHIETLEKELEELKKYEAELTPEYVE